MCGGEDHAYALCHVLCSRDVQTGVTWYAWFCLLMHIMREALQAGAARCP